MITGYTAKQVCELTGLDTRSIQFYNEQGLVEPTGGGRGIPFYYREYDLSLFKAIALLKEAGITVRKIKHMIDATPIDDLYYNARLVRDLVIGEG